MVTFLPPYTVHAQLLAAPCAVRPDEATTQTPVALHMVNLLLLLACQPVGAAELMGLISYDALKLQLHSSIDCTPHSFAKSASLVTTDA